MEFKTKRLIGLNADRAKTMGLKPAPTLNGYFFEWKDCVENLAQNIRRTQKGEPPKFMQLFLETINACNLKCPMCYTGALGENGRTRLEFLEWKKTIQAAKQAGIEWVVVAGCGEPLLDDKLWHLTDLVRNEELKILVFTNGTLVTPDMAKKLKENCTTIITKFFAMDPKAHDALVGVKGEYVKTRKALVEMLETGLEAPNLGIDLVITKQNQNDLDHILRMCRMFNVVPYFERLAQIGRGEKVNGNTVLTPEENRAIFERLRQIDETEFGFTWEITDEMPALANAGTDKRMIAAHVDVYGNLQPGLATGQVIGNIRDVDGGVDEIFQNADAWGRYYQVVAEEIGLEMKTEDTVSNTKMKKDTKKIKNGHGTHQKRILQAIDEIKELHENPACKCTAWDEEKEIPQNALELVDKIENAVKGTDYEEVFQEIRKLILNKKTQLRLTGYLLLTEMVYGRRHLEYCNEFDLQRYKWEAWGTTAHLNTDPIWKIFNNNHGYRIIDRDYFEICANFMRGRLKILAKLRLEFAITNEMKCAVPGERSLGKEKNTEQAELFKEAIAPARGGNMPIFWNLAYEHTGGRKDIPKNEAFHNIVKEFAGEEIKEIYKDMQGKDPIEWLRTNTCCLFVGANDLASLAGFMYHEATAKKDKETEEAALGILRIMCENQMLKQKIMRKKGLPRQFL